MQTLFDRLAMPVFSGLIAAIGLASVIYIYSAPPPSMFVTRDGVPYFSPPVLHPETGESIDLDELVRHYKES